MRRRFPLLCLAFGFTTMLQYKFVMQNQSANRIYLYLKRKVTKPNSFSYLFGSSWLKFCITFSIHFFFTFIYILYKSLELNKFYWDVSLNTNGAQPIRLVLMHPGPQLLFWLVAVKHCVPVHGLGFLLAEQWTVSVVTLSESIPPGLALVQYNDLGVRPLTCNYNVRTHRIYMSVCLSGFQNSISTI